MRSERHRCQSSLIKAHPHSLNKANLIVTLLLIYDKNNIFLSNFDFDSCLFTLIHFTLKKEINEVHVLLSPFIIN